MSAALPPPRRRLLPPPLRVRTIKSFLRRCVPTLLHCALFLLNQRARQFLAGDLSGVTQVF